MKDYLPDEKALEEKGFEYWEKGEYQKAVGVFKKGIWKHPKSAGLHTGLGFSYLHLKEFVSAVDAFENALNLDADDPQILRGLGLSYIRLNWADKARPILDRAAGEFNSNAFVLMEIAYSYLQANEYEDALKYAEKALDVDEALDIEPDRPDLLDFYSNVLYDDCRFEEALAYFEKMPLKDIVNPITLQRIVELYKFFEVDEDTIGRYRKRLDEIERENSVDGFIEAMMNEWEKESATDG